MSNCIFVQTHISKLEVDSNSNKNLENNIISWDSDEGFSVGVVKEAFNREIEYAEDIHNPKLAKCYEQAQIYVALHE